MPNSDTVTGPLRVLRDGRWEYWCPFAVDYLSPRYGRRVTIPRGRWSDGASGPAIDIWSLAWWVHDELCRSHQWADGTLCTPLQASTVLGDILAAEGRGIRAWVWRYATLIGGPRW